MGSQYRRLHGMGCCLQMDCALLFAVSSTCPSWRSLYHTCVPSVPSNSLASVTFVIGDITLHCSARILPLKGPNHGRARGNRLRPLKALATSSSIVMVWWLRILPQHALSR